MTQRRLEEVSDGKYYDIEDLVKADACGCEGCSACCHHVGDLVALTPFDVYEMRSYLNQSFDELLDEKIALREEKKIQLPYLKMQGEMERCSFLDQEGRCQIHAHRPNICRLFPLGRVYENGDFKYFLQVNNCQKPELKEVKVKEWIGIENYDQNKAFILAWHELIKALGFRLKFIRDEKELADINKYLVDTFYRMTFEEKESFYDGFVKALPEAKRFLGII